MLVKLAVLAALVAAALAYPTYWSGQFGTCYAYTGVAPVQSDRWLCGFKLICPPRRWV